MNKIEQIEIGGGNTNTPPKRTPIQEIQCKNWTFTIFNYTEKDFKNIENWEVEKIMYQSEICPNTGKPHLQGWVVFINKKRMTELKKLHGSAHFEKMKGTIEHNVIYCSKERTSDGKHKYSKGLPKPITLINPERAWQQDILNFKSDDRTIEWYWESEGGAGKTSMAKYLAVKHKALYYTASKKSDILHSICEDYKKGELIEFIIIDYSRSAEEFVNYDLIETVKNGFFYSGKYEGGRVMIEPPRVLIFSNWEPDTSKLSKDRWKVVKIKKDKKEEKIEIKEGFLLELDA